jgi:hypothetical protein
MNFILMCKGISIDRRKVTGPVPLWVSTKGRSCAGASSDQFQRHIKAWVYKHAAQLLQKQVDERTR